MAEQLNMITKFRMLIDDISESRFDDDQINLLFSVATTDVINELMTYGYDHGLIYENSLAMTISSGDEYVDGWSPNGLFLYPLAVRRNETDNDSYVKLKPKQLSITGEEESVWFETIHDAGPFGRPDFRLGYYRKATQDMRFTMIGVIQTSVSTDLGSVIQAPSNVHNLILYKALSIASSSDTDKASVWEGHYAKNLAAFGQVAHLKYDQVADVYDSYGNN